MPKCESCGKELPKGTKKVLDPYEYDVGNTEVYVYLCDDCYMEYCDDI